LRKEEKFMALSRGTAKLIFFLGTLISLILFLALTIDTHRQVKVLTHAENLSEQVVQGKRVWQKYNCNDCHTILGFGGYYAPDMTKVYNRIGKEGIIQAVKTPEVVFASSWRRMPQQKVQDKEVDDLVAFFKWVGEIDTHDWPPQDSKKTTSRAATRMVAGVGVSPGAALFKEKGCFNCHKIGGVGGTVGGAMEGVVKKYDVRTLAQYIEDPASVNSKSRMAKQPQVNPEQAQQIAQFLADLK
jgi:nitric oxide reductase subunit C